ncbi:autotransporter assembly complex protein TamA [Thalassotalea profundi]|uniref:Translocation and assembly module subunit TamA n=1 Tax=Thalassotalea profundi TaxID=2036687 RepID=A0ABQ3J4F4_9GAMM|nr:autotransporter assembly complex family protein [Thalassotalea profundi]GHF02366.1 outer membrane protein assembly factor [Thalassotalea profundi]
MQSRFFLLLIILLLISPFATSSVLSVNILDDLPDEIAQNINAYLGELPENETERAAFVFSAKKQTQNALKALGYYRAVVTTRVDKPLDNEAWTLSVQVILNQPTEINKVEVNIKGDALTDKVFLAKISNAPIKSGDTLHHGIYEQFKSDLVSLGLERGYFDSKFLQSNIAINKNLATADILIHFDSGPRYQFGEVKFSEFDMNADVLAPLVPFKNGDFYQQSLLQNLQNELDKTQYFSNVIVRPDTDNTTDNILPVDIYLEKAKQHQFNLGLGYATDTKERFSFGWKTPLVNRYGHRQELRLSYSKINPTGYFIYSIPLSHPNDDVLQLQTELEQNDYGGLTSGFLSFQVGRVYLENDILRQPYLRHLTEEWHTDGVYDDASYFIPGFSWSDVDRKGSLLDPSSGFRQYYNLEGSYEEVLSETSFLRFNARWKYITSLSPKHRIVARAELGYVLVDEDFEEDLSPSLRFYAGGDQSIRGFAYQSIGPKLALSQGDDSGDEIVIGGTNLVVASLEYQYYFSNTWRGALFVDAGSVNNTDKLDLVYSVGPGLHYISPIGPIRFALGYSLSEENPSWRIHFSIGADL